MDFIKELFSKDITKRILVLLSLVLFIYALKNLLNVFLLTFLFAYLTYSMKNFIVKTLRKVMPINDILVTVILYIIIFVFITLAIFKYIPIIINQTVMIIYQVGDFDFHSTNLIIEKYLSSFLRGFDIGTYTKHGVDFLFQFATNIGRGSVNVFIALILSMCFMLEIKKINHFLSKFYTSRIGGGYRYIAYFGRNFMNSFGKVMQAQIILSLITAVFSVIGLWIMDFPQLLGLGVMIFILNLIPVMGTFISLIPLAIIAFKIGGVIKIVYILILIILIHALGTYVINPKLMADKTELPIFLIFVILIVSEHFMGVWGLLVGIPLFMFLLDLLNVKVED